MTRFWPSWTKEDADAVKKQFSSDGDMSVPEDIIETYREVLKEPYNKIGWSKNDMRAENFPAATELQCKAILCNETACTGKRHCGVH